MITNELVKVACEYYRQGNSLKETTEFLEKSYNFKINLNTLGYHLKKTGLKLRSDVEGVILRARKHINIQKLLEHYKNKIPIRELSRNSKIARGTIRKILVENGIIIMDSRSAQLAIGYIKEKSNFNLTPQEKMTWKTTEESEEDEEDEEDNFLDMEKFKEDAKKGTMTTKDVGW